MNHLIIAGGVFRHACLDAIRGGMPPTRKGWDASEYEERAVILEAWLS